MKPNILFLFTDQQRFDTISALGNPLIRTPVLDRLVNEGTAFTRCYTPSPVCVSARHALLYGQPPHRSGCVDNGTNGIQTTTFIESLKSAGYRTHGIGKMHFRPNPKEMRGFDSRDTSEPMATDDYKQFIVENGYEHVDEPYGARSEYYYIPQTSQLPARLHHSHWVADRAIDFLQSRDTTSPFFLWAGFIKPHPPFESPTPWNRLYRALEMPRPHRPESFDQQLCFWNRVQNRYKYRDSGHDDLLVRTMRAAYYSSISFIDYNIGRILDALGSDIDNTLIVFSSDHGEMLGDFGSYGKRCMLDAAVRVPMLIRWPGAARTPEVIDHPVSVADLNATFADAACVVEPSHWDGYVSLANSRAIQERKYVISQFSEAQFGTYMIADNKNKYSYCAADSREWLWGDFASGGEDTNLAESGAALNELSTLRKAITNLFQQDDYIKAITENGWRQYPTSQLTDNPDFGLLFQDPAGLRGRIERLGAYARPDVPAESRRSIMQGVTSIS